MNEKKNYIITTIIWITLYLSFVFIYLNEIQKLEDYSLIDDLASVSIVTILLIILVIFFEQFFPHNRSWNKPDMQTFNNIGFSFLSSFANTYGKALALIIMPLILSKTSWSTFSIWPNEIYFPIQVLIGIFYYDLIYYWYHRISHKNHWIWRLHRLHHSSEKLNVLALGKFNVLDIFFELLIINSGLILIQMPVNVFFVTQAFMIPATLLSHSNFDVRLPAWLNWIIISPTTHRVHHSINKLEHDTNYGGFSHFWDIIFKTYDPVPNIKPIQTGISGHKTSPWIWGQFFDFLKKD